MHAHPRQKDYVQMKCGTFYKQHGVVVRKEDLVIMVLKVVLNYNKKYDHNNIKFACKIRTLPPLQHS